MALPAPFGLTTPSASLGENPSTEFTTVDDNEIISVTQPTISEYLWRVPTTSLGVNLTTEFFTIGNADLVLLPSAGNAAQSGFTVPSMNLQYQASTFIYTKASPIVINEDPVQTWYMS
jgi:hypothetical protein